MKKLNLRKITAFAAALVLSAQSGICVLNAEETNSIDDTILEALYDPSIDSNGDGTLTEYEIMYIHNLTLDGNKLRGVTSFDFLEKFQNLSDLTILNWENFDFALLNKVKNSSQFKYITFDSSTMKKTDEQFQNVVDVGIKNTVNFDLDALSSFNELQWIAITDSTLKDVSVLGKFKNVYFTGDIDYREYSAGIIFPDIEVKEGYVSRLYLKPRHFLDYNTILSVKDNRIAKPADYYYGRISDNVEVQGIPYIFAETAGKTEYEVKDKEGNLIGSGNITVVPDKPADEPLVSDKLQNFRIIEPNDKSEYVFVLYENGDLYSFNKEGKGEFTKIDDNAAEFYEFSRARYGAPSQGKYIPFRDDKFFKTQAVLYKDGVLKVNGEAVHDKNDYTVVSSDKFNRCLCSDGKIRKLSVYISEDNQETDYYEWNEVKCDVKIKAVTKDRYIFRKDENFYSGPICQLEDGKTAIIDLYSIDARTHSETLDLGLSIAPARAIQKFDTKENSIRTDNTYYISDTDNNLYEVKFKDSAEPETRLVAKNIKDLGYLYDKNDFKTCYEVYLGEDNEYHDLSGAAEFENNDRYMFSHETPESEAIRSNPYFTEYTVPKTETAKGTAIHDRSDYDDVELYSHNDSDGTEKFSCLGNYASLTHVKDTLGAFFDGKDFCVLVTREDNTLWKYCIEGNTFTRIDPGLKAVAPKKYGAKDIVSMMRYLCGIDESSDWMDFNGDSVINVLDFIRMKKEMLKNF